MLKQILIEIDTKIKDQIKTIAVFSEQSLLEDVQFVVDNNLPYTIQTVLFNPTNENYDVALNDYDKANKFIFNEPISFRNIPLKKTYELCQKYFDLTIHKDKIIFGDSIK